MARGVRELCPRRVCRVRGAGGVFARVDPPSTREDVPEQPVVPMIKERRTWPSKGIGVCDIVLGDWQYWENQRTAMQELFVGYLSPTRRIDIMGTGGHRH